MHNVGIDFHTSDAGIFSTRCRRRIAIFSSPVNVLRPFFMAISFPGIR